MLLASLAPNAILAFDESCGQLYKGLFCPSEPIMKPLLSNWSGLIVQRYNTGLPNV